MARLCEQSSNDSFKDRASIPKEMARPCEQSSNDFFKREGNHSQRNGAPRSRKFEHFVRNLGRLGKSPRINRPKGSGVRRWTRFYAIISMK